MARSRRRRQSNRCKSTLDTSTYYSKQAIWTLIPYLINIVLFLLVFLPIFVCSILCLPIYMVSCKAVIGSSIFCLRQYSLIVKANYRLKGMRGVLLDSALIYAVQSIMICFLALDLLIFPSLKQVEIQSPVFITGCPRSGTTFTHRIMTTPPSNRISDSPYAIHALWEILCPALSLKYCVSHLIDALQSLLTLGGGHKALNGAYDTQLNSEAAEEGLFGMHCFAGDFYVEFLPVGFWFDVSTQYMGVGNDHHWRQGHVRLLKQLLQRQIYWTGKTQIVAKSPSLTWFLPDIIDEFPDCKILLLVRDPYDMMCSNLSLFEATWKSLYGDKYMTARVNLNNAQNIWITAYKSLIWRRSEQSRRYLQVLDAHQNGGKEKHLLVVRYDDIKNNLLRCFEKCMEFCELTPCEETIQWIKQKESKQKTRRRTHRVAPIASYGINPSNAKEKFNDVIRRWNFQSEWK